MCMFTLICLHVIIIFPSHHSEAWQRKTFGPQTAEAVETEIKHFAYKPSVQTQYRLPAIRTIGFSSICTEWVWRHLIASLSRHAFREETPISAL